MSLERRAIISLTIYNMDYAVVVEGLSKQFYRYHADRPWTLHETLVKGLRRLQPAERFWALRDISFCVAAGRVVGWSAQTGQASQPYCVSSAAWDGPTRDT